MTRLPINIIAITCLFLFAGASAQSQTSAPAPAGEAVFPRGKTGTLEFREYKPLAGKPITLYYYIPAEGDIKTMPVLFSMHGAQRTAGPGMNSWNKLAAHYGFIVLAPEYAGKIYNENEYQFGGVMQKAGSLKLAPEEDWTYKSIEAIFDFFKKATGNKSETYHMFGHSAGGQFVHRYLLATPNARVGTAVAANPGTWTFPDKNGLPGEDGKTYPWPFSVKGTPFGSDESLRAFFGKKMIVQIGTEDTATSGKHVPKGASALAQGKYRHERGRNFHERCAQLARQMNVPFNWKLVEVPGVGHSGLHMIYGKKSEPFEPADLTPVGGCYLIFGKSK